MSEKERLQNALQLYYERKYKGTVNVVISTPLRHIYGISIDIKF